MRLYGSIQTKFWTHPEIQKLSDQAKLLATYLLSSPHTNMLGCFRIPMGYIAEDLQWSLEVVEKALNELTAIHYLTYDNKNSWIYIHQFLKYNAIENPNQARSIAKLFNELPKDAVYFNALITNLLEHSEFFCEGFRNTLETLHKPFRNQDQEQKQDQDQKQEQELFMSGKPDVVILKNNLEDKKTKQDSLKERTISSFTEEAKNVLDFLNEKTGRAYRPVSSNLKFIMARLQSGASVTECRQIIARKYRAWKSDPKMAEYLRPATLFNAIKFEQYMGEIVTPKDDADHELS